MLAKQHPPRCFEDTLQCTLLNILSGIDYNLSEITQSSGLTTYLMSQCNGSVVFFLKKN